MRIYTPSTLLQKILEKILNGLEFEEVSGIFSLWYYRKSQRWQRREEEQLSEYWDSGLTIQEYSELKELPYESTRRWIRVLEKARQDGAIGSASLELVEVKPLQTDARNGSGIRLLVDGIEIAIEKGFDGTTLCEVLNLLKGRSCSASAVR